MKISLRTISCLMSPIVAIGLMPLMASALSAGGMSIAPALNPDFPDRNKGWFIYEQIEPGAVIEDVARVINLGDTTATMAIEAVDAGMNDDGGFGLVGDPSENKDIGKWIELSKTEVTLLAGKEEVIPFKITIPADAEVGDHIGGLAVYQTTSSADKTTKIGGSSDSVSTRVGARIYLTIKGDITRKIALLKRSMYGRGQTITFGFSLKNTGNVRADLNMSAKIYGIWGLYDKRDNLSIGQIFPHKTINMQAAWPGKQRPIFGLYWAKVTIEDTFKGLNPSSTNTMPPTKPIHTWMFVFFVPYTQLAILLALAFLIWLGVQVYRWRSLVKLAHTNVVAHSIKPNEHLVGVAQTYGIDWKLLAKLNDIKPPYSLQGLTKIYVPDARGQQRTITIPHFLSYLTRPLHRLFSFNKKSDSIVVEKGDTKKEIEAFTGLKWEEIAKYNRLSPNARPVAGQTLEVPRTKHKRTR